ncbi:MAG: redox-regulated ATPase YchF [Deltaproteobacteria bacterium]|jgi:GTP-binding protein YchF|nr:redox-regulated ATPase YchF [Deltaproteobacteria bacterium]
MKIGIIGLPNSGKTTVFNALTGLEADAGPVPTAAGEPHVGMVQVPDRRIDHLAAAYQPKKTTYADIELLDLAGLLPGSGSQVLNQVRDVQALIQVVRAFDNEMVPAYENRVAPAADVDLVEAELLFADLELVERRLERIAAGLQKGQNRDFLLQEQAVLQKCHAALEDEKPLRELAFSAEEERLLRTYQLLTKRPELFVVNHDEGLAPAAVEQLVATVRKQLRSGQTEVVALSAKVEMEIAQLEAGDRRLFMEDLGIEEPALNLVARQTYRLLGLISFFTVGPDEVKAWTIEEGTPAVKAAGKIHSDIERGFIRAEVLAYDDFVACEGDFGRAKKAGTLRLEGKDYQVRDGDIINFRFNV